MLKGYQRYLNDGTAVLPREMRTIEYKAFQGCSRLTEIVIPDGIEEIEPKAFGDCRGLNTVVIPRSVTKIGLGAFSGCINLKTIVIPNTVSRIGPGVFLRCRSLASIEIPDSVTRIDVSAFRDCSGLKCVTFPNSLAIICYRAFSCCTNLSVIDIPESVEVIGAEAFSGCTSITSVKIPERMPKIEEDAFRDCVGIKELHIAVKNPSEVENNIIGCGLNYSEVTLYVPTGTVGAYHRKKFFRNFKKIVSSEIPLSEQLTISSPTAIFLKLDHSLSITKTAVESFELFINSQQKIDVVAEIRGIKKGTVVNHLMPFIAANLDNGVICIDCLVSTSIIKRIHKYLINHPDCEYLRPIFDYFKGSISFDDIRIAIACLIRINNFIDKQALLREYNYVRNNKHKRKSIRFAYHPYVDEWEEGDGYDEDDSLLTAVDGEWAAIGNLD